MARSGVATLMLLDVAAQSAHAVGMQPNMLPIRVILVGDSTIAPQTGYGDALCRRFQENVTCLNLAKGGRSSASYRAEGSWEQVTKLLADGGQYRATYVLIQFGHNDQPGKPGRSTDLVTGFTPNMARYAQEVKSLHGIPVLVTPLSRRSFKQNVLQNDLQPWAEAVRKVSVAEQVPLLDLNADSSAALEAMGATEADTLAMAPPTAEESQGVDGTSQKPKGSNYRGFDRTHLGAKGAAYFAHMVERELIVAIPAVASELTPEN